MPSFISVFVLIFGFVNQSLFKQILKDEFCTNNSLIIEAAVVPFDTNILLLFSRDMVYELEIKTDFEAVITSAEKLGKRFKEAEPPIDFIKTKIQQKDQIQVTNCHLRKMWTFRYTDNQLLSTNTVNCTPNPKYPKYVEIISKPKSADHYVIEFWPNEYSLIFALEEPGQEWMLRSSAVDKDRIKLVEQTNFKEKYDTLSYNMNGHEIKAAFLHKAVDSANQEYYWYLIADRLYCRVLLNEKTFEECKPKPITEWIQDCKYFGGEIHVNERKEGKDNTLVIAILVAIIAIAIIVIIVVVFFIVKEVKDQTTSTNTGSDQTIRSN